MSSRKDEKLIREKRLYSDIMRSYKKAIENIMKKGRIPSTSLDRMNELKLERMRKLQFQRSMKKLAKATNGEASKS
jgi:hypothetical protein|tara:strand:- start:125 stop:352 length:228 start_codon:yes stop_codon:yes gene_type:complete